MKFDISQHIGTEETQTNENGELQVDEIEKLSHFIEQINDSMASFHIGIRVISERLSTLERHVAYLLTQDPKVGAAIKEHTAKAESDEPKA
jgi:hypothetical protein